MTFLTERIGRINRHKENKTNEGLGDCGTEARRGNVKVGDAALMVTPSSRCSRKVHTEQSDNTPPQRL